MKFPITGLKDVEAVRHFYESVNTGLNQSEFGEDAYFLNLGFVGAKQPCLSPITLSPRTFDSESHQLVLEVISDVPLDGKRVVEVACGRGGAAYVLATHFNVATYTGIDLCSSAVAFCSEVHQSQKARFITGNAMALPLADSSADVIINIESSHNYDPIRAFYDGVKRVLRPNGYFLYADSLSPKDWQENEGYLESIQMQVENVRDITDNVCLACEQMSIKRAPFHPKLAEETIAEFLAIPGSDVYKAFKTGDLSYRILKIRKT